MKQDRTQDNEDRREVRLGTRREMKEGGKNKIAMQSFTRDAGRPWNRALDRIKMAPSIVSAKAEIRKYCKTLPI